jgi:hypothetical protein
MTRTLALTSFLLFACGATAAAQPASPPANGEEGDAHRSATSNDAFTLEGAGRFRMDRTERRDRLRRLGQPGAEFGRLEGASALPLRSVRGEVSVFDGVWDGAAGDLRLRGLGATAEATARSGRFVWREADGTARPMNGVLGEASASAYVVSLKASSDRLALPSALGNFEASASAEAAARARAELLGIASMTKAGGIDVTGNGVLGLFAEASMTLPALIELAGVSTRVTGRLSGYAGAGALIVFRLRLDPARGRFLLDADLGAALGLGGAAGVTVDVDARQLLRWLTGWGGGNASSISPARAPSSPETPSNSAPRAPPTTEGSPASSSSEGLIGGLAD